MTSDATCANLARKTGNALLEDVFDRLTKWLQQTSLLDVTLEDLVKAYAERLVDGGVPVARLSLGRMIMHPVIGLVDVTWQARTGRVDTGLVPRRAIPPDLTKQGPFGE